MKSHLPFVLWALAIGAIALLYCNRDNPAQPTKISDSAILYEMAVTERKQAERYLDSARNLQAKRDTLYITRTRLITKHDSIIRQLPPSEILPARLDSCLEVGEIVLGELKACDSTVAAQGKVIEHFEVAYDYIDSSNVVLSAENQSLKKQLDKSEKGRKIWKGIGIGFIIKEIIQTVGRALS